jgi:hypothetical protein
MAGVAARVAEGAASARRLATTAVRGEGASIDSGAEGASGGGARQKGNDRDRRWPKGGEKKGEAGGEEGDAKGDEEGGAAEGRANGIGTDTAGEPDTSPEARNRRAEDIV